jgi:soluble lytic murein transglycosylase
LASLSRRHVAPFSLRAGENVVPPPLTVEPAAPASVPVFHLERWRELRGARLNELARDELAAIDRQSAGDEAMVGFLIEAYQAADGFKRARDLASGAGRRSGLSSTARQRLLYPLGFWDLVDEESRQRQLDPLWVVSIMRQESMFDPEARSPADARGLMQLLPSTATRLAEEIRLEPAGEIDLTQPRLNIHLGTAYLRALVDRFDGEVLKAVAAYNGGAAAVERWQRQFEGLDVDEFVESITYRETRDYVKRVAGNYRVYRDLYVATPGS